MQLYKYFPPERADVLKSGMVCYSAPSQLNDPFDIAPPSIVQMTIDERFKTLNWLAERGYFSPTKELQLLEEQERKSCFYTWLYGQSEKF